MKPSASGALGAAALGADALAVSEPPAPAPSAIPLAADFEGFFREHARHVAGLAYRLLGSRGEVDDVVQEVFLAAYRGVHTLRDAGKVRPWLATLTVRIARRRIRKQRFWGWLGRGPTLDAADFAGETMSERDRGVLVRVYRAASKLSVEDRLAWVLRVVEGHELVRVAELCECSLATAKRRVARAQATVEEALHHG